MKFSLEWLKYFLDTDAGVADIAAALNRIGHEVEGIEDPADRLAGFRVAKVLTADKHPDADKLQVLTVDTGEGDPLQVVCGAPNARAGMKGVLGLPGAVVPANGMELRKSAIRGVESNGMMCSVRELELGEEHDGIIELPEDAPVGQTFADYHDASPVFDVAITPNRPDCMGVQGIARDLAAAGLGTFKPVEVTAMEGEGEGACPVEIRTDDPEGCPAFYGRVIRGVDNTKPSPEWMQRRLIAAGQRPISALVDATNYLMLAFGRPAHVYDLAKLSGPVVARRAKNGERVEALNEKTYTLDDTMTVIADDNDVHDIAGIMGGEHSGATAATTDVLLEIAYFDPERIGVTGRKLGLASDARTRFERGVDPAFLDDGLAILTSLILKTCGGKPTEIVRAGTPPTDARAVAFDPRLTSRLGGVDVAQDEQRAILEALDFQVGDDWQVTCPLRRHDIEGPADLVEEVVRIHGLDHVESVALPRVEGVARPTASPLQKQERKLRRAAAARGLNEAVTWSFLPTADAEHFADGAQLWVLDNPISEDMKAMRPSLVPGLLSAAKRNADRGADGSRLFEIGRRYFRGKDGASDEKPTLGVVLAGNKTSRGWANGKAQGFDAYDAKGEAVALLEAAGAPVANLMVMGEAGDQFHPGQSATLRLGPKNVLARFGALHPKTLKAFDVDGPVMAVEIFLDSIPAKKGAGFARAHYAPPALQSLTRDFAFLVPADLAAGDLVKAVRGADKKAIVSARVFDVFEGQGVPEGKKSVAVEVTLQPGEKSFTDAEIKAISDKVVASAGKQGAELRG
ncbi:phenylalanine--tRNA ligase subunit beta [Erythrobacter sp.]|uniref:phenylalanine--tRNA ligase subunit beta n=1 Tax=Erythrobacter sp. TaxID=1042 RepID=UPI001B0F0775|nr:phenylalanine--tRNA ligase subunit beta [Erythrobacter sp.]MBO6527216.1 phenylalanine--tRNA ligase subunit beta [Erythrobacter sp.]MBO6531038.1 phenylalanine--tRNA ligase subunit beta [Erythrobacter sp.]